MKKPKDIKHILSVSSVTHSLRNYFYPEYVWYSWRVLLVLGVALFTIIFLLHGLLFYRVNNSTLVEVPEKTSAFDGVQLDRAIFDEASVIYEERAQQVQ